MQVSSYILTIIQELTENLTKIDNSQADEFIKKIKGAGHIFLSGVGRSGLAINAFANRLVHLGYSVSIVGEISSPHSKPGDLVIICSGSGETKNLKNLAEQAIQTNSTIVLVTMRETSTIAQMSEVVLTLPGSVKDATEYNEQTSLQPMGTVFEQLAFLVFDGIFLKLMDENDENSQTMYARHADFE